MRGNEQNSVIKHRKFNKMKIEENQESGTDTRNITLEERNREENTAARRQGGARLRGTQKKDQIIMERTKNRRRQGVPWAAPCEGFKARAPLRSSRQLASEDSSCRIRRGLHETSLSPALYYKLCHWFILTNLLSSLLLQASLGCSA